MMMAKNLKAIIDQFPDNAVVSLGDNWDCNIEGWSYDTEDGIVKLKLTDGFTIIAKDFIDGMFSAFENSARSVAQMERARCEAEIKERIKQ